MKGYEKIRNPLHELLADEPTAINLYMVQSEMCADWGYEELLEALEKSAIDEIGLQDYLSAQV
jgi:bacterioferritin